MPSSSLGPQRLFTLARLWYLIGIVLALVLIVPVAWFPLQLGKVAAFATCGVLAALCFAFSGITKRIGGVLLAAVVGVLPIVYLISWRFSIDRSIGITGLGGLEVSTVLFTVLSFLVLLGAFFLFRSQKSSSMFVTTIFVALIVTAVFQLITVLFGTAALPFQTFADRSVNLIGKWNDLGLLLGILVLWSVMKLEWSALSLVRRILLTILLLAVGILLDLIHFPVVWALLCGFSILFIVAHYLAGMSRRIPWYASAVAVVSILFLIFGTSLNTSLTKVFPVSSLEVRPSYSATLSVIGAAHHSFARTLVGSGPDTFRQEWFFNRPAAVNLSPFWNLDFTVGYSTLLTIFSDTGLLGAIAWLIPLLLSLLALFHLLRSRTHTAAERMLGATLGVAAVYLWVASGFYVLSQNVVLLSFAFVGALLALVYATTSRTQSLSRLALGGTWLGLLLFVMVSGGVAYAADQLFLSQSYLNQGLIALNGGDTQTTLARATTASKHFNTPGVPLLTAQAHFTQLQGLASASSTPSAQQAFVALAQQTITETKNATLLDPQDYQPYLLLGQEYNFLDSLKVQGAYQLAQNAYMLAAQKDPTNPEIPLLQATLEAAHSNSQQTQQFLQQSLTLKQNFTNAILFLVQLDVAQKDIKNAILAAQAAVQSAPSVPSVWFELGLLYYSGGDTANAIPPLEQAIKLQSDYANAKYFLGLSYYAQGKTAQAIQEFTDLQSTNPDNQEVALILANMQAGKPPFTSAKPPISTPPQHRATAPISE